MIAARFEPGNHGMVTDGAIEVARGLPAPRGGRSRPRPFTAICSEADGRIDGTRGLGVVLSQQGRAEEAAALFARGVAIEPQSVRFHANLRAKGISAVVLRSKLFCQSGYSGPA
jgi:hypothetical protein